MPFTGSCHCGAIAFTVDEDAPGKAMDCNCSICRRRGALHHFTSASKVTLETPRDALVPYRWNTGRIAFQFCGTCGCAPFGEGESPDGPVMAINLRCTDVDLDALDIQPFDGAHLVPGPQ